MGGKLYDLYKCAETYEDFVNTFRLKQVTKLYFRKAEVMEDAQTEKKDSKELYFLLISDTSFSWIVILESLFKVKAGRDHDWKK